MMKVVYLMLKRGGGAGALLQGEEPTYFGNDGSREHGGWEKCERDNYWAPGN